MKNPLKNLSIIWRVILVKNLAIIICVKYWELAAQIRYPGIAATWKLFTFVSFLNRYSHSLQKQIHYNKKCYMIDSAMVRLIGFRVSEDRGRLLENIVLLHLKMQKEEVFFHKGKKECDFVLRKGNKIVQAIQVTTNMDDLQTRKREIDGLLEAMEEYQLSEGMILTENNEEQLEVQHLENSYSIRIIPVWKWLLEPV